MSMNYDGVKKLDEFKRLLNVVILHNNSYLSNYFSIEGHYPSILSVKAPDKIIDFVDYLKNYGKNKVYY